MVQSLVRLLGVFLICNGFLNESLAQDQFVQFTYYDQLTWSPDGRQLAFRCILLDESQPEKLRVNVLVKDLDRDRLLGLKPQPERFVISRDKKHLIFAESYGLYWMDLERRTPPIQIYFRNPAASWYFQDFGFLKKKATIYVDRMDAETGATTREFYQLPELPKKATTIEWAELKTIREIRASTFNLPNAEWRGNQPPEIKLKQALVKFAAQSEPGNYELVYQSTSPKAAPEILLKNSRPRLLSANPALTEVIVSVFQSNKHRSYRFSVESKKLIPIENKRYFSLSWLDDARYLSLTDDGLFLRNIDLSINQQLNQWQLPDWCQSIDLSLPNYELQVGFEPEKKAAEQLATKLSQAGYWARIKYFKDRSKAGYRVRVGGFVSRKLAQQAGEELEKKGFNCWIDEIADHYDYFNSPRHAERKSFLQEKEARVEYRLDNYLRSRIVLKIPHQKERVIVDEMNNIPGRGKW